MLNRFRGPEDRKESLLEVFDPSMFTVNHPAWESPPGTSIDLPALTCEVAASARKDSEIAAIAREEVRRFREHAHTYDDEELMQLGSIAIAGLADQGRTFQNREAVLGYVALNASTGMEDLWAADDTDWLEAPTRHIEFPDMVARRREQLLRGEGPATLKERDFACYSDDEVRAFALDMRILTSRDRIQGLQGLAGIGKTTTLETIREGAERSGYAVEGFAPTGRAAAQLREAGIFADTLQGYLAWGGRMQFDGDPGRRHLFMVDESSLSSTKQMREFLERIGPQDRVLLIGDTRQHQGVEAGKPFEQLQQAGMRTAQLDQIMRQKDPELLRAVEHLAKNETKIGIDILQKHGRVIELADLQQRIEAIAKSYAARPENTLIVSPDNASRQAINQAVRVELQEKGAVAKNASTFLILTPRSEMTGADRAWAQKYQPQDVLHYSRGSKEHGIDRGSHATVVAINPKENLLTVRREDGE
jgi:AAA domain